MKRSEESAAHNPRAVLRFAANRQNICLIRYFKCEILLKNIQRKKEAVWPYIALPKPAQFGFRRGGGPEGARNLKGRAPWGSPPPVALAGDHGADGVGAAFGGVAHVVEAFDEVDDLIDVFEIHVGVVDVGGGLVA